MLCVVLAVLAALAQGASSVLQRRAARDEPDGRSGLALLSHLVRRRSWLLGIAAIITGFGLQAGALATGPIALVQPVLVLELGFALVLAALVLHSRLRWRDWAAVAGMSAGLAVVLFALRPSEGDPRTAPVLGWVAGTVVTFSVIALLVVAGHRHRRARAGYLGVATGMGFGLVSVLVAAITAAIAAAGPGAVLTTWQTYLLIVAGPGFFVLLQKTLQAGRLVAAQPGLTLANPIVAATFGVAVFGEHVQTGGWLLTATCGGVLIAACTVALARSPLLGDPNRRAEVPESATALRPTGPGARTSAPTSVPLPSIAQPAEPHGHQPPHPARAGPRKNEPT